MLARDFWIKGISHAMASKVTLLCLILSYYHLLVLGVNWKCWKKKGRVLFRSRLFKGIIFLEAFPIFGIFLGFCGILLGFGGIVVGFCGG